MWDRRYDVLLFLHVVGAIVWIGLGVAGHAVLVWADRSGERAFAATFQRAIAWVEPPAIVVGPVLLLATGIGLVVDGPWGFGDTWIVVGLAGYAAALAFGAGFQAPGGRRLNEIVGERGHDDPEAIAQRRRLTALMWPELAILLVVLLAMTTKPTGAASVDFWAVVAAILAGAAWLTARAYRAAAEPGAEAAQPAPHA